MSGDLFGPVKRKRVSKNYWTRENCVNEARKYRSVSEFKRFSQGAWCAARINGWLLEINPTFEYRRESWTYDKCRRSANKFKSRWLFQQQNPKAYNAAKDNGWLPEICSHMVYIVLPPGHWSKENCLTESLKYRHRRQFQKGSEGAYCAARRGGFLNEICSHMKPAGHLYARFIYEIWSKDKTMVYVGLSVKPEHRLAKHRSEGPCSKILREGAEMKIVSNLLSAQEAQKEEQRRIDTYITQGLNVINSVKAGGLGAVRRIWTVDKISDEANKFRFRTEFQKASPNAYAAAHRYRCLDVVCAHMPKHARYAKA